MAALNNSDFEVTELLLEQGADVNARTDTGVVPLHWAVLNANPETIALLLDWGAAINYTDSRGNTPCTLDRTLDISIDPPVLDRLCEGQ